MNDIKKLYDVAKSILKKLEKYYNEPGAYFYINNVVYSSLGGFYEPDDSEDLLLEISVNWGIECIDSNIKEKYSKKIYIDPNIKLTKKYLINTIYSIMYDYMFNGGDEDAK